ncbi:GIY-YIG nuclease family protein [Patescibacteria group bacterium]|nr:GIY-YIG nuclease family protein [Patescibacteria group bacterium]
MKNQVLHTILPTENTGFKIVEMANWPAKVFIVPRANLKDLKDREGANSPALYFLFGDIEEGSAQKLYIGETENLLSRLLTHDHDEKKIFWNTAVGFIGSLDKAKVKYLESVANEEAIKIARFDLENRTVPRRPHLSEFDEITTKDYFDKARYVLSVLGYPVFESVTDSLSDRKIYFLKSDGADARAQLLTDGSINVLSGSLARVRETEAFFGWSKAAREKFIKDGTLVKEADGISYKFTKDIVFKSPTAAAATVSGRPINGWTAWKDEKGNTLDENIRK